MRTLFIVQGEGRGHLTQAIALSQILSTRGHEVVSVLVGVAKNRPVPDFFLKAISAPVYGFDSPNLLYDNQGRFRFKTTFLRHAKRARHFVKSLKDIDHVVRETSPDLIINFYELLGGLYNALYRPNMPMVCIAHQYLMSLQGFPLPKGHLSQRLGLMLNSFISALGAKKRLALAFHPGAPVEKKSIVIVPPLIRKEVLEKTPKQKDFILIYLTEHALSKQIIHWHEKNPGFEIQCFWDNPSEGTTKVVDSHLTFHQIDAVKYLAMMADCRAMVTTAGFETQCEAALLGKPLMTVPVPNHYEQLCNAADGEAAGVSISSPVFDLSRLLSYIPDHPNLQKPMLSWVSSAENVFINELSKVSKKEY